MHGLGFWGCSARKIHSFGLRRTVLQCSYCVANLSGMLGCISLLPRKVYVFLKQRQYSTTCTRTSAEHLSLAYLHASSTSSFQLRCHSSLKNSHNLKPETLRAEIEILFLKPAVARPFWHLDAALWVVLVQLQGLRPQSLVNCSFECWAQRFTKV